MTSPHWGRADPFGLADIAPFRDADDLLRELMDGVASLAAGEGGVLLGELPPLVASFEARLRLTLASPDDADTADATDSTASHPNAPLLATALRAWKLDLAGRWCLAICLGWELHPRLNDALASVVARPSMTVDGLANLLGDGSIEVTARVSRALHALQRLELLELDATGPWFQRGVRATEAALALALAASPTDLWQPSRRRSGAAGDPLLLEALATLGPTLQLRGDVAAALTALEDAATELGLPLLVGNSLSPGGRSVGAALRDALAAALPVVLRLDTAEEWAAAAQCPWPARTLIVTHHAAAAGYQLVELT